MKDGRGSPGQVPPLAGSLRVLGSPDPLVRILLHGMVGELEAGGQTYRGQMPATTITGDEDLASILTYIRGSFGNNALPVHPDDVTRVREATKDRMRSWTALELEQYK
jgi:mono/diheme cytochrome c family protein